MLKMDFLGLITLSIIHKTLDNIKMRHGIDIDIEAIPKDDRETYELYGRGDTTIVFQFESPGMKEWLRILRPLPVPIMKKARLRRPLHVVITHRMWRP